jgi:putative flippase GtrA
LKWRGLTAEFLRYCAVGGVAFLADFLSLTLCRELLFAGDAGLFAATTVGFLVGIAVNYALSLLFVFTRDDQKAKGRRASAFLVFLVVGVIGLGLTHLGMWAGSVALRFDYRLVKIVVAGIVLIWNYLGRKLLVFR